MDRCKTLPMASMIIGCLLGGVLTGCSTDRASQSNNKIFAIAGESLISNDIKNITEGSENSAHDDLRNLRTQLEKQQQQLETMSTEQQALQAQLKRQRITLNIKPAVKSNAGRTEQGTASTAYIAFLEEESQFTEVEDLAAKEVSIIPNRETSLTLHVPQDARFVAIKVGLRYTKKRSQLLIPLDSLNFETPLVLNVGACDVNITGGIDPELAAPFTTKLKYYQQPLVSCS